MDRYEPRRDTSPEAALVRKAQAGDRAAFDQLAARYRGGLLVAAYARTRQREDAEDLVQQVLTDAWRKLAGLREPGVFGGWLRAIMLNACRCWRRRRRPEPVSLDEEMPGPMSAPRCDPIDAVLARERQHHLREALDMLPAENRLAFVLHVIGRYRSEEIAELLTLPLTTVEGRIHRARRQLQRLLREEENHG